MWVCLVVALVSVKGVYMYADNCGTMTVTEPLIANRPATVTFSLLHQRASMHKAQWYRFINNSPQNVGDDPEMYTTSQGGSTYTLTIRNISQYQLTVAIKLGSSCWQYEEFKVTQLSECGLLYASGRLLGAGRSVILQHFPPLEILVNPPNYHSFTLLFSKDADNKTVTVKKYSYPGDVDKESLSFKHTLDPHTIESNGTLKVECEANSLVIKYSTEVWLEKAVKPTVPKLKSVNSEVGGCESCIFISAEKEGVYIACNVTGGTGPKNVTISVGTHTLLGEFNNNLYLSHFTKDKLRHGSKVRCEVLNPALDRPLTTTKNVYIYREKIPNFTEIKLYDVIAGEEGTIECVSTDMRPASNLILNVDGISCNTTEDVSKNNNTDTYNVTATCSFTASKTLHNKIVKCCFGNQGDRHCQTKQLNILFPPGHVEAKQVEFKDDEEKFKQIFLNCYVSSANPPCRALWEIPPEITDYRTENFNSTIGLNDGEQTLSVALLNVNPLNHGQQIQCLAVCENFEVKSSVVSLQVPGAPLMKVFPGNVVTKREGESLTLNCTVDSIPKSNLSWVHGNEILSESGSTRCDKYSACYQSFNIGSLVKSQSGNYTCISQNDQFEPTKEIVVLRIIEPDSLTENAEPETSCPEVKIYKLGTAIGGTSALILIVGVVVAAFCYVIRQRKKHRNELRSRPEVSGPYEIANRSAIETDHQYDQTAPVYEEAESAYETPI